MVDTVTIEVRQPTGTDEYGNVVYDTVDEVDAPGLLQSTAQTDLQDGRAAVGTFLLLLPVSVMDIADAFSAYVINGARYEGDGQPAVYYGLHNTEPDHLEATVVRSTA